MKRISLVAALLFMLVSYGHAERYGWTNYSRKEYGFVSGPYVSFVIDSEGNLWMASLFRGDSKFDGTTATNYTEIDGLSLTSPGGDYYKAIITDGNVN